MTSGVSLNAKRMGAGQDVLLLHGLFGSAKNWLSLQRKLAQHWCVHALDLRNHGDSAWADAMDYQAMAADVATYCEQACAAPPVVVGHSMGGKAAMTLALTTPKQVAALVVVDIAPVDNPPSLVPVLEAMRAIDPTTASSRQQVGQWLADAVPEERVRMFLLQNLVKQGDRLHWRVNLDAIASDMPAILGFPQTLSGRAYPGRTLFIRGAESDYVADSTMPLISRLFPHARLVTIEAAGHWLHADKPDEFLAYLSAFLRDDSGVHNE